jgi:predicted nucleic acid-binding protein
VIRTGLVDTSVYIAGEHGRPRLADPPAYPRVSMITIAELLAGVLAAPDDRSRRIRQATLDLALRTGPLGVDRPVAEAWATLRRALRDRKRSMPANDSWIAATAIAYGLPVVTQDEDYVDVPGLDVIRI